MIFHLKRRVYFRGRRIHHGLTGAAITTVGLAVHSAPLMVLGVVLMLDDAGDFPWRWTDAHGL